MRLTTLFTILFLCLLNTPATAQEGAGLLFSDLNGAFPKGMWRKQPRSEINYLLERLPADAPLRSIQVIKRNMLLSRYDTSQIIHDTDGAIGKDLLTLRLGKLMEMGLWEDAFTLYTKTTEDPGENDSLAQIGVLLILSQKGLSTACLEEKVLSSRFESDFWRQMDGVCAIELGIGGDNKPEFPNSDVLQAVFYNKDFNIPAKDISVLEKLSPLELAILSLKERIDYKQVDFSGSLPPHITKTFLKDSRFPSRHQESLEEVARKQALLPESPLTEAQLEQEKDVQSLSQQRLIALISDKLRLSQKLSAEEGQKLADLASKNPENYFYIQILNATNGLPSTIPVSEEESALGLTAITTKNMEKVNFLKSLLDKPVEFSNNPDKVYEKQISLTPDGGYVMPTGSLTEWLRKTQEQRFVGLSLLIILSNVEKDAEETTSNMLKNLSTVGLIDQAHQIAKEELAHLMKL